nr:unnamed protein product [Digitaria exilis]
MMVLDLHRASIVYYARAKLPSIMPNLETPFLHTNAKVALEDMDHESIFEGSLRLRQLPEIHHHHLKSVEIIESSSTKSLVQLTSCIVKSAVSLERLTLDTLRGDFFSTWSGVDLLNLQFAPRSLTDHGANDKFQPRRRQCAEGEHAVPGGRYAQIHPGRDIGTVEETSSGSREGGGERRGRRAAAAEEAASCSDLEGGDGRRRGRGRWRRRRQAAVVEAWKEGQPGNSGGGVWEGSGGVGGRRLSRNG